MFYIDAEEPDCYDLYLNTNDDFRMCSSTKQIGQGMDDKLQEVKKSLIFPRLVL
uniref:Uncharacterized protein n=1 Tax=Solanum lycopersicum TaxID=4081 RepID=K4CR53_SOLLC